MDKVRFQPTTRNYHTTEHYTQRPRFTSKPHQTKTFDSNHTSTRTRYYDLENINTKAPLKFSNTVTGSNSKIDILA